MNTNQAKACRFFFLDFDIGHEATWDVSFSH